MPVGLCTIVMKSPAAVRPIWISLSSGFRIDNDEEQNEAAPVIPPPRFVKIEQFDLLPALDMQVILLLKRTLAAA
jgi:hypothetical protein